MATRFRIRDEGGIALVMSLGVLVVLTITTIALLTYTSSGVRSVRYTDSRDKAGTVAEAGLNEAASIINNCASNPTTCDARDPSALPAGSDSFDGGSSASWSGSVNGDTWTLSSTSSTPNPSGAAALHRTASTQFRIGVDGEGSAPAWQYTYTDDPSTCLSLSQSSQIQAPFYVAGNMCLSQSANPTASEITVKGHITLTQSSKIGSASLYIDKLHTSGCSTNSNGPWTLANCTPANRVYANHVDSTFANVSKPAADFNYWYAYSKPGPRTNCTSGSFPGGFDNDTTLNHSRSAVDLMPNTAYSCTVIVGSSMIGKIAWTPGSPGTLQVSGVLFFDGDISESSNQGVYVGRASIYTSGAVTFSNSAYLCGYAACDVNLWDGDVNMITFVAMGCQTWSGSACSVYKSTSASTSQSSKLQGGIWAYNDISQSQSSMIEGPEIARQIIFGQSSVAQKWPSIDFVSYGSPAPIGSTKLIPISGTFTD